MRLHGCCPRSRMFRGERCAEPRAFGVSRRPQDHGRCRRHGHYPDALRKSVRAGRARYDVRPSDTDPVRSGQQQEMVGRRRHRPFGHEVPDGQPSGSLRLGAFQHRAGHGDQYRRRAFHRSAQAHHRGIRTRSRQYDFVALRQSRFGRKLVGRDARRLFDHSGRREPRKVQRLARQGRRFHAEPQVARRRAYSADLPSVA